VFWPAAPGLLAAAEAALIPPAVMRVKPEPGACHSMSSAALIPKDAVFCA
jgi:hypothetical protein